MTRVGRLMLLGLLAGCGMPLFHAPPAPVRHSAPFSPPASGAEIYTIDMHRSGCLGTCPDYRILLTRGGFIRREGFAFVAFPRCAKGEIPPAAFDAVADQLIGSGFFALDSVLDQVMDAPELVIAASLSGGRRHSVVAAEPPLPLNRVGRMIDSIAGTIEWDSLPTPAKNHPCPWPTGMK